MQAEKLKCLEAFNPYLYEEFGMAMFDHLNGQFALAIYDAKRNTLHIARDPFGINPLYYKQTGDTFIFASEVKSILEHPSVERKADVAGLDQVLCLPGVVSPRSLFRGIRSVKPGQYRLNQPFETDLLMIVLMFSLLVETFSLPAFA